MTLPAVSYCPTLRAITFNIIYEFSIYHDAQMPTAAVAAVAKLQPQFVMSNVSCLLTERESAKGCGGGTKKGAHAEHTCFALG